MTSHCPHFCAKSQLRLASRAASSARDSQSSLSPVYGKKFFVTHGSRWRLGKLLVERQGSLRRFLCEVADGVGDWRERTRCRSLERSSLVRGESAEGGDETSTVIVTGTRAMAGFMS